MTGSTSAGTFDELDLEPASFISHHRPFIIVWIALFVSIAGIGMVSPLLPVFAEDMGASGIWLGLAFSGFAISQIPLMPFVGGLSDRFGRKSFLWCGLLIYALAAAGYFWSPGYQELVIFRVFSGIGSAMVIPTAFAYVGELAPRGGEGRYMGLFNIALIAGFGIGPVLGGSIHDSFGMDATFVGMGLLSLAGCAIVFLLLPKRSSSATPIFTAPSATPDPTTTSFVRLLKDNGMQGIVTFQMVYGLLFGTVLAFLGIWMTTVIGTSVAQVGIVLSVRPILNGTLAYPCGWLADRMNRALLATAGMLMVSIGTFSISSLGSFGLILGLFMVMGMFESMAIPAINALTVEKGRDLGMGSVMGIFQMAMSLGLVIGAMTGGFIDTRYGIVEVFQYTAVLALLGLVAFGVFTLKGNRRPNLGWVGAR